MYNPYIAQQYLQVYGVPASVNLATYPYNIGQYVPNSHGYTTSYGYPLPGPQTGQLDGPSATAITTSFPTLRPPYPTGRVLFLLNSLLLLYIMKFTNNIWVEHGQFLLYLYIIYNYLIRTG